MIEAVRKSKILTYYGVFVKKVKKMYTWHFLTNWNFKYYCLYVYRYTWKKVKHHVSFYKGIYLQTYI